MNTIDGGTSTPLPAAKRFKTEPDLFQLDESLLIRIFVFARASFKTLACTSKKLNDLLCSDSFYNGLRDHFSNDIFDAKAWKRYFGAVPDPEPRIPLDWLLTYDPEKAFLTLVPESVKFHGEGGEAIQEPVTALNMGKWSLNPTKEGYKVGYFDSIFCWQEAVQEILPSPAAHWVWLSKEITGIGQNYEDQMSLVRQQGGDVSEVLDTITTLFAEHIRSGNRYFIAKPGYNENKIIRTKQMKNGYRITVAFSSRIGQESPYYYVSRHFTDGLLIRAEKDLDAGRLGHGVVLTRTCPD